MYMLSQTISQILWSKSGLTNRIEASTYCSSTVSLDFETSSSTGEYNLFLQISSSIDLNPLIISLLNTGTGCVDTIIRRSMDTRLSAPKFWDVESVILKVIFSNISKAGTPLQISRMLSVIDLNLTRFSQDSLAMGRIGKTWNTPFFVIPCTLNERTPFLSHRCDMLQHHPFS